MSRRAADGTAAGGGHLVPAVTLASTAILLSWLALGCNLIQPKSTGERLYSDLCAKCHGVDGRGNVPRYMGNPYADLTDDLWKHGGDRASIEGVIRDGIFGEMPPNSDLQPDEMRALLDYLEKFRS